MGGLLPAPGSLSSALRSRPSGCIFGMDYVFGLLQPEAMMDVLCMIEELIVGRDK